MYDLFRQILFLKIRTGNLFKLQVKIREASAKNKHYVHFIFIQERIC